MHLALTVPGAQPALAAADPSPHPELSQSRPGPQRPPTDWPPSLRSLGIRPAADIDLLEAVSASQADRVLVIGEAAAETLCDALHRGCRSGSAFRTPPAHPEPVEVVVAPCVRTEEAGQAVLACARHALPAGGRLALRLVGAGAVSLARALAERLRTYGFERVRLRGQAEGALVHCRMARCSKTAGKAF